MAEKTIVFALNRAIALNVPDDCYVIDLFDLYRTFAESPTPFACLLTEITNDLCKLPSSSIFDLGRDSQPRPLGSGASSTPEKSTLRQVASG